MSDKLLQVKERDVSSAKMRVMLSKLSAMSFIYIRKNNGPKTEPCGTPAVVTLTSE